MTPIAWKSRAPNALWVMFGRALTGTIRPKRGGRVQLAFLCAAAWVLRKHEREDGAGAAGRGSTHRNSTAVLELVSGLFCRVHWFLDESVIFGVNDREEFRECLERVGAKQPGSLPRSSTRCSLADNLFENGRRTAKLGQGSISVS